MISDFDSIPELPAIIGPAKQIAYRVDDIDEAMRHWNEEHAIGPFLVTRNAAPLSNAFYRVFAESARYRELLPLLPSYWSPVAALTTPAFNPHWT